LRRTGKKRRRSRLREARVLDLVRRTILAVSLKTLKDVDSLWRLGADAIALDLRGLPAEALNGQSRKWVRISAGFASYGGSEVLIMVDTKDLERQLESGVWPGVAGVVFSGVETGERVSSLAGRLENYEARRGIAKGSLEIIPVLETALGVWNVREIIKASPRVRQVSLDEGSLSRDLDIKLQENLDPFEYARGRVVIEATAAKVQPLDVPHPLGTLRPKLPSEELFRLGTRAKDLGFKGGIFASQEWIEPFNRAFSPTDEQVEYYKKVREVFAEGVARGTAAVPLGKRMIDVPVDEWAKTVLERGSRCRARDEEKRRAVEKAGKG
jgi:citrate lyase subunit beta/citryl-CoA lyase